MMDIWDCTECRASFVLRLCTVPAAGSAKDGHVMFLLAIAPFTTGSQPAVVFLTPLYLCLVLTTDPILCVALLHTHDIFSVDVQ